MVTTMLLLVVLVIACVWYSGRQPGLTGHAVKQTGEAVPLLNVQVYTGLVIFALIMAFIWG